MKSLLIISIFIVASAWAGGTGSNTNENSFYALFETTKGSFVVYANSDWAPYEFARFSTLINENFYFENAFYKSVGTERIVFGINSDPAVNAEYKGYIPEEITVNHQSNLAGYIGFEAKIVGDKACCRTTQLFINLQDNPSYDLQGIYPVAQVVEGMDVVHTLNTQYGASLNETKFLEVGKPYLQQFPELDYITKVTRCASLEECQKPPSDDETYDSRSPVAVSILILSIVGCVMTSSVVLLFILKNLPPSMTLKDCFV